MATRQVISLAPLVAALAIALSGCGDGDGGALSKGNAKQMDARAAADAAKVDRMIEKGELPPVARRVLDLDGTLKVNFIDGPNGDNDVVHEGADGTSGKKLVWDLDGNGKIDAAERTLTERELYDATLRRDE
jgi:hypothetical protein